jgi:hypothetical protein
MHPGPPAGDHPRRAAPRRPRRHQFGAGARRSAAHGVRRLAQDPPPSSCIVDEPVDPLGPGYFPGQSEFTTIDVPAAVLETAPYGINDRGQIVGGHNTAGFVAHGSSSTADLDARRARGLLRSKGVYIPIDVPRALATNAYDINARGQVVGIHLDADETIRGYLRDQQGVYSPIDLPGAR